MTDLEADLSIANARIRELEAKLESKVEVVRCKECWHYKPSLKAVGLCFKLTRPMADTDFCSFGERREK